MVSSAGGFDGLYMTKDFGHNWTRVGIPEFTVTNPAPPPPLFGFGTNDYTRADHSVFGILTQGGYDVAFAIDPLNPNVVYLGGTAQSANPPTGGLIRIDTTGLQDALAGETGVQGLE